MTLLLSEVCEVIVEAHDTAMISTTSILHIRHAIRTELSKIELRRRKLGVLDENRTLDNEQTLKVRRYRDITVERIWHQAVIYCNHNRAQSKDYLTSKISRAQSDQPPRTLPGKHPSTARHRTGEPCSYLHTRSTIAFVSIIPLRNVEW